MPVDAKRLGAALLEEVRLWVEPAFSAVVNRVTTLERNVGELPAPKDGERGEQGLPGRDGADGANGQPGEKGDTGEPGERGADGRDGKDGVDGPPGKDGRDGESVSPESVRSMLAELVQKAVAEIPKPQDGAAGRDALMLEPLPAIDESKSYPRGTYALHRGGTIFAFRNTEPISGELERAGWTVAMNGVAEEREELSEDGRTYIRTTIYTSGAQMVREQKSQAIMDRGVFKPDVTYQKGDAVTWGGSSYIANCETSAKPDSLEGKDAWRLMAKRGRDGKDGKNATPGTRS